MGCLGEFRAAAMRLIEGYRVSEMNVASKLIPVGFFLYGPLLAKIALKSLILTE